MKHNLWEGILVSTLLVILVGALTIGSFVTTHVHSVKDDNYIVVPKVTVTIGDGDARSYRLPATLNGLEGGTLVTEVFSMPSDGHQLMLVNPYFSPVDIYADDKLIYSYGTEGTLPSFMIDRPMLFLP